MSGTCVGWGGGAACCLPVGAGPFCPKGLSWAIAPSAEQSKANVRKVLTTRTAITVLREYPIVAVVAAFDSDPSAINSPLRLGRISWFRYSQLVQQERPVEGDFAEAVIASARSAVASVHVGVEDERVLVGLQGAQLCNILRGLP